MSTTKTALRECKAYVRWRPLTSSETVVGGEVDQKTVRHGDNAYSVELSGPAKSGRAQVWKSATSLSDVFDGDTINKSVFDAVVAPTLPSVLDGAVCNVFAYGHSGSGKTHTIIGYDYEDVEQLGICLSTARTLYQALNIINESASGEKGPKLGLGLRLYEMRRKSAFDLLNNRTECFVREGEDGRTHIRGETEILEDGKVRVRPIVTKPCWTFDELRRELVAGLALRATGTSTIHDQSSRTHAILELEIINAELLAAREAVIERQSELVPVGKRATDIYLQESSRAYIRDADGKWIVNPDCPPNQARIDEAETLKREFETRVAEAEAEVDRILKSPRHPCLGARYVFVDLAGAEYFSEGPTKSSSSSTSSIQRTATAQERQEGRQINADLFALKEVIRARALDNKSRIPFRSSALTMALREHFVQSDRGHSAIILTVSPAADQYAATMNTLKYGSLVAAAGKNEGRAGGKGL